MFNFIADLLIFSAGKFGIALLSFVIGRLFLRKNPLRPSGTITNIRLFFKTWLFTIVVSMCLLQLKINLAMSSFNQQNLMDFTLPLVLSSFFNYKLIQLHIQKRVVRSLGVKQQVVASEDNNPHS